MSRVGEIRPLGMLVPLWIGLVALATMPAPVQAQGEGRGRGQQHDVTSGPPVTGCPVCGTRPLEPRDGLPPETAGRLDQANMCVSEHLDARALTSAVTGETIAVEAQEAVLRVIRGEDPPDGLVAVLEAGGPADPARPLADALVGLIDDRRNGQLAEAITRFNALVESRSEEFLANPSAEIVAIHAILAMLGLESQCQRLDAIEICVIESANLPKYVDALLHPVTGDTIIVGRRIEEVLSPDQPQYAGRQDWFLQDLPLLFQRREFVKYGARRQVPVEDLRRVGEYEAVPLFTDSLATGRLNEILVPVGPGCDFQPYAPMARIERPIVVCVVTPEGVIEGVEATFRPLAGDTVIDGRAFREIHHAGQPQYASGHDWFVQDQPIIHSRQEYVKFGVQRHIEKDSLRKIGEHEGVPIFADTASTAPHAEIFMPLGPGCEFQPYLAREAIRIRG